MAAIHAASFPAAEAWDADAFSTLMASVGVAGLISPLGGFLLWRRAADEADIVTIAVMPQTRRTGLGRALLRSGIAELALCRAAHVFLEVAEGNEAAIGLYRAEAFAEVGLRRGYYPDGGAALLMRRAI